MSDTKSLWHDLEVPDEFMHALLSKFGPVATRDRPQSELLDPLYRWSGIGGTPFLVPSLEDPTLWLEKAWTAIQGEHSFDKLLLLVPDERSAPWFNGYVRGYAVELEVGRMTFKGHDSPFPGNLILAIYGDRENTPGRDVWDWTKR